MSISLRRITKPVTYCRSADNRELPVACRQQTPTDSPLLMFNGLSLYWDGNSLLSEHCLCTYRPELTVLQAPSGGCCILCALSSGGQT